MNLYLRIFCLLASMLFSGLADAKAERTPEDYERQAQQIVSQTLSDIPAYAILAKQQPDFVAAWQEQLRRQLIVGHGRREREASDAIGLGLALLSSNYFFSSADDDSVNRYFQQQRRLLADAQQDPRLCRLLLNTPGARNDQSGAAPWLLEKKYRVYRKELQPALTGLIVNAQDKWPRTLPDEQNNLFIRRIVSQMVDTYGQQSLKNYELASNDNASPETRCLGLHQLYETISTQHLELRAQLVRGMFGKD